MKASEFITEYGVGRITAQNATADVKPGDEFKNVKKLQLASVGHPDKLTSPENTLVVNTPGDLDWYKIGQHYPTLAQQDPKEFGQSDSDMVITFANKAEKEKFEKIIAKAGVKYRDIGGTSQHPEIHGENPLDETIRKQGNKYVIYSKKGKKLGSYTTKKAAQKRLGQIEYFKHAG